MDQVRFVEGIYDVHSNAQAYCHFKSIASHFHFNDFCLVKLPKNDIELSYSNSIVIHSLPCVAPSLFDGAHDISVDPIFTHIEHSNETRWAKKVVNDHKQNCPLLQHFEFNQAFVIPLIKNNHEKFALVYLTVDGDHEIWDQDLEVLCERSRASLSSYNQNVLRKVQTSELQPREVEIIGLTSIGLTSSEIASELDISEFEVHANITQVKNKLGALNKAQIVTLSLNAGIV
jgi:DNA-binding CsgD family transcriptional regulator